MRVSPVPLLLGVTLALCGLCIAQWFRESTLRHRLDDARTQITAEVAAHHETTKKLSALENEIARISQLRADTEAKLLEVTDALTDAQSRLTQTAAAVADHNDLVQAHNDALTEANQRLQRVTAERDHALQELNQRTRAYNDLRARQPNSPPAAAGSR